MVQSNVFKEISTGRHLLKTTADFSITVSEFFYASRRVLRVVNPYSSSFLDAIPLPVIICRGLAAKSDDFQVR